MGRTMLKIRRRIEKLEEAIMPLLSPDPLFEITVDYVDPDGTVVESRVVKSSPALPSNDPRWRRAFGRAKGCR